jgi:hypothetical protein
MADTSESYDLGAIAGVSDASSDASSKAQVAQSVGSDASSAASIAMVKATTASSVAALHACTHYDIEFSSSLTEDDGIDQDKDNATSAIYYYADIRILSPLILTEVLWDLRIAETYTLLIDGVQFGNSAVVTERTADVSFTGTRILMPANKHRFRLNIAGGGGIQWSSTEAATYYGTLWASNDGIYIGTTYAADTPPIKLSGYIGTWETCRTV